MEVLACHDGKALEAFPPGGGDRTGRRLPRAGSPVCGAPAASNGPCHGHADTEHESDSDIDFTLGNEVEVLTDRLVTRLAGQPAAGDQHLWLSQLNDEEKGGLGKGVLALPLGEGSLADLASSNVLR